MIEVTGVVHRSDSPQSSIVEASTTELRSPGICQESVKQKKVHLIRTGMKIIIASSS